MVAPIAVCKPPRDISGAATGRWDKPRAYLTRSLLNPHQHASKPTQEEQPAVVPLFIQFRLEFRETELLADLLRHWLLDIFWQ
jgi:hypothetical protein